VNPPADLLLGLPAVIAPNTRLIVLGSFPGAASLAAQQYYAHPRNQFWRLLSAIWDEGLVGLDYASRLARLRAHRLGLWDVYAACLRDGSLDSAIREPRLNDLSILRRDALRGIAHNGGESARAMRLTGELGAPVYRLPSSSPANASWSFDRKLHAWREVFAACGVAP
jgi:hypoxanthine-DNA glycosylase